MDKGYIEKLKTELYAAQAILDQATADKINAWKAMAAAEEKWSLAHAKVDTVKNMLIAALEK